MLTESLLPAMVRGSKNALKVLWLLAKVMIPAILVVTWLDLSGGLDYLSAFFSPFMAWFALPGEAAVPLVAGNISGLYAGVGAMAALSLSSKQKLILAAMLMLCHSLPQEGAIVAQARGKVTAVISARIGTAVVVGLLLSLIL